MGKAGIRRRIAGAGAALAGCAVLGLGPVATAPSAHADLFDFDWLSDLFGSTVADSTSALDPTDTFNWADLASWFDPSAHADLPGAAAAVTPDITTALDQAGAGGVGGLAAVDTAPALAATGASANVSVPIDMQATTEPLVNITVGGGNSIPVVLDTGSNGLVVPWYDIGMQGLFQLPSSIGIGSYSGGLDYFYVTLPETVGFVGGPTTETTTPVDVVLYSWNPSNFFQSIPLPTFLDNPGGGATVMDAQGVLGIAPDAVGPNAGNIPTVIQDLPAPYNQGVLIDEPHGQLVFGANPLSGGTSINGLANANLQVTFQGPPGPNGPAPVSPLIPANNSIIDSGGVFGTAPLSMFPASAGITAGSTFNPGTEISVFDDHGTPLYSYTVSGTPNGLNTPHVVSSGPFNTGYTPFSQMPVYIGYNGPNGVTTTFGGTPN
ncbi:MAG TPA: PecA family PE domain-processing aspartic protease [Mycobacterium sp.]